MDNTGDNKSKKQAYSLWDGIKMKPVKEHYRRYLITSAEELAWVADIVNRGKRNFAGKTILLKCDIDLDNHQWVPIGISEQYPFCGEFDGGGHIIRGVNVRSHFEYIGFFGCIQGNHTNTPTTICDVQLFELNIEGIGLFSYSGGLAGYVTQNVEISNCVVTGKIISKNCVGGVIGIADERVNIKNCIASGMMQGALNTGELVGQQPKDPLMANYDDTATIVGTTDEDITINESVL
ncbi:MAG: GLUG motif-containing protein [Odoribacter sp.]